MAASQTSDRATGAAGALTPEDTARSEHFRLLIREEESLRSVATLVAAAGSHEDILTAICRAASDQLDGQEITLIRFEKDGTIVAVATHGGPVPPGTRVAHPPGSLSERVARTGRPARADDFEQQTSARIVREFGIRAAVGVPIFIEGRVWGMFTATSQTGALPEGTESRLEGFAQLTWAAIANTDARASLKQSRARVIAAADEARRRLQRDVHDGAQQRLVHTIITLKLARDRAARGERVDDLLVEALNNAEEAQRELRDIVRGILPSSLTRAGLGAGLRSIVADTPIPVEMSVDVPRMSAAVETTGYFVAAEAITNAVKHAGASRIILSAVLTEQARELTLVIEDDGIGGADPAGGTGLIGLADRVEADDGHFDVVSPPGGGTRITARLPVEERG